MAATEPHGRKADHLRIAAAPGVLHRRGAGLDGVRLRHRALPERDLRDVTLATELLGVRLAAPLVVSAMTGGTADAERVNAPPGRGRRRARRRDDARLRARAARGPEPAGDLPARALPARPPLLLANLGGVQLAADGGPERAEALVDLLDADGLTVHLNPIQEAVQPEGEPSFGGVAERIAATVARLAPRPVVVKEVGFGMDGADVALLRDAGVAAVDVAGAGGTNWALVEGRRDAARRRGRGGLRRLGRADGRRAARWRCAAAPGLPVLASGGVRDGVDAAKCLALGAVAVGLARPFLQAAQEDRAGEALGAVVDQLRIATWAAGAPSAAALGREHLAVTA